MRGKPIIQALVSLAILALISVLLLTGCTLEPTTRTPSSDAVPINLIPKEADGLYLWEATEDAPFLGTSQAAATGQYGLASKGRLILNVFKFANNEDAVKSVTQMKNIIKVNKEIKEDQVIVFASGSFLFAAWGDSADEVKKLAQATGFYETP